MIGIIPAAGTATRMMGLPKMLLPTPDGPLIDVLFERMARVPLEEIVIGAGDAVRPFLGHYGGRARLPLGLQTDTMSETVLICGLGHNRNLTPQTTLFGMPDTWMDDSDVFLRLAAAVQQPVNDVAVAVFRARPGQHRKVGMVELDGGRVLSVVDKPAETHSEWLWGALAWKPAFWQWIRPEDPHVGYALPYAIAAGLRVRAVKMEGEYYDAGTPTEYFALIRHLTAESVSVGA